MWLHGRHGRFAHDNGCSNRIFSRHVRLFQPVRSIILFRLAIKTMQNCRLAAAVAQSIWTRTCTFPSDDKLSRVLRNTRARMRPSRWSDVQNYATNHHWNLPASLVSYPWLVCECELNKPTWNVFVIPNMVVSNPILS
jgi:hypothetical protein